MVLTSASGVVALLQEDAQEVRLYALDALNAMVDGHWSEIADFLDKVYGLQHSSPCLSLSLSLSFSPRTRTAPSGNSSCVWLFPRE